MGCCMCKKVLKILAGLALIAYGLHVLQYDQNFPWLIAGLYLALRGVMPMVCQCDAACCTMEGKKKR